MPQKRHTVDQIVAKLRKADVELGNGSEMLAHGPRFVNCQLIWLSGYRGDRIVILVFKPAVINTICSAGYDTC